MTVATEFVQSGFRIPTPSGPIMLSLERYRKLSADKQALWKKGEPVYSPKWVAPAAQEAKAVDTLTNRDLIAAVLLGFAVGDVEIAEHSVWVKSTSAKSRISYMNSGVIEQLITKYALTGIQRCPGNRGDHKAVDSWCAMYTDAKTYRKQYRWGRTLAEVVIRAAYSRYLSL